MLPKPANRFLLGRHYTPLSRDVGEYYCRLFRDTLRPTKLEGAMPIDNSAAMPKTGIAAGVACTQGATREAEERSQSAEGLHDNSQQELHSTVLFCSRQGETVRSGAFLPCSITQDTPVPCLHIFAS
jgi:hypothetical protein